MANFDAVLEAYLKREAGFEDLNKALGEALSASPQDAAEIRRRLEALRDSRKLPLQDYAKLELQFLQQVSHDSAMPAATERAEWHSSAHWQTDWASQAPLRLVRDAVIEDSFRLLQQLDSVHGVEAWEALDLNPAETKAGARRVTIHFLPPAWGRYPQAVKVFIARIEAYCRLDHPCFTRIYGAGHSGGRIFVTTEHLPENRLDSLLSKYPTGLPLEQVHSLLEQLAGLCTYALQQGLPELFMRPDNIYYDPINRQCKIVDIGLDALFDGILVEDERLTPPFSRAYRSCESLAGGGADHRDNTYTLACLAYELIGGQHPFGGKTCPQAQEKQFLVTPVKALKKSAWRALNKGLQFTRKDRELTPAALNEALFPHHSHRYRPLAAAVFVLSLLAVLWLLWWQPYHIRTGIARGDSGAVQKLESWNEAKRAAFLSDSDSATKIALLDFYTGQGTDSVFTHLRRMGVTVQRTLLEDPQVAAHLQAHYLKAIDAEASADNFAKALDLTYEIGTYYSDLSSTQEAALQTRKEQRLEQLNFAYQDCLHLTDTPLHDKTACLFDSRAKLAHIEPAHPLLNDPELPLLYREEVNKLLAENAYQGAALLLQDWTRVLPKASPERDSLQRILDSSQAIEALLKSDQFAEAGKLIAENQALYPDNERFQHYAKTLEANKKAALAVLYAKYQGYREKGTLLPAEGEDLFDVRNQIQRIDPQDALLSDASLHQAFFDKTVETAGREGETLDRVRALFDTWQDLFSDAAHFQAQDQETRERAANRVALRYVLKAEELKTQGDSLRALDYVEFALELKPVQSVQDKLLSLQSGLQAADGAPQNSAPAAVESQPAEGATP